METDIALEQAPNPAISQVKEWRARGLKIGFANGCFDILHSGHITLLNMARSNCDKLIVGISSDAMVKKQKGKNRPILSDEERAYIVSALAAVDMVIIIFDETPIRVLQSIKPDIIAKGMDYEKVNFPEKSFLESYGAKFIYTPIMNSSSKLIQKMENKGLQKK